MFTVCSAQLESTQPANEDKKEFDVILSQLCSVDYAVSNRYKGGRDKEELGELG